MHRTLIELLLLLVLVVGGGIIANAVYQQGYSSGTGDGYRQGATDGYNSGYTQGKTDGYTQGKTDGYTSGYGQGKTDGYGQGVTDGSKGQQDHGVAIEKGNVFSEIDALGCKTYDDGSVIVRMIPNGFNNFKWACA
jgi:flagellar biosynthesis/type III secretory pathway protein FliH